MQQRTVVSRSITVLAFVLFALPGLALGADPALTGKVTSAKEGAMEGVLVSAKKSGSTITTTVVTDAGGVYRFPRERLEPGQYAIRIRAAGYDLEGRVNAQIEAQKTATLDLNLVASDVRQGPGRQSVFPAVTYRLKQ